MSGIRQKAALVRQKQSERVLLGIRFREIREYNGYRTRKSLSKALEDRFGHLVVTPRRIRMIEDGSEPSFLEVAKFAELIDCPIEDFKQHPYGPPPVANH